MTPSRYRGTELPEERQFQDGDESPQETVARGSSTNGCDHSDSGSVKSSRNSSFTRSLRRACAIVTTEEPPTRMFTNAEVQTLYPGSPLAALYADAERQRVADQAAIDHHAGGGRDVPFASPFDAPGAVREHAV